LGTGATRNALLREVVPGGELERIPAKRQGRKKTPQYEKKNETPRTRADLKQCWEIIGLTWKRDKQQCTWREIRVRSHQKGEKIEPTSAQNKKNITLLGKEPQENATLNIGPQKTVEGKEKCVKLLIGGDLKTPESTRCKNIKREKLTPFSLYFCVWWGGGWGGGLWGGGFWGVGLGGGCWWGCGWTSTD